MARKPRVEFDGAFYHVIVRGNQRQKVFGDDRDRLAYLERLEQYRERFGFSVYAYVLMANHIHLLVETKRVPLSKIMQGLQFTYTQTYNRRHRTVGHLFQGRYKTILCDRNEYLLELVRYIHLNQARMRNQIDPLQYRWSSHRGYMGEKSEVRIETDATLAQFGKSPSQARRAYVRFMEEGVGGGHEEKYYQATDQRFLGDEAFVETVAARTTDKDIEPTGPRASFGRLLEAVTNEYGVTSEQLVGTGRRRGWPGARKVLVDLARGWGMITNQELGKRLGRDPSMISRLIRDYQGKQDRRREANLARALAKVQTHA